MKKDSRAHSTLVEMNSEKPRTAEEIFRDMHRELRSWNAEIPESPDRMDPILRIMLRLYASQLASIDSKIERTWKSASDALIKSLCPESMRWPAPAFTVMQAEPSDPVIHVDPQTQFFYKEERDEGHTFFFSSLRTEKLIKARLTNVYFAAGGTILDISPPPPDSTQVTSRPQPSAFSGRDAAIYVAIEHEGPADDFENCIMFLQGNEEALKQLKWSKWLPGIDGDFYEEGCFCPGLAGAIDDLFSTGGDTIDWGGLRKSSDLFKPLENNFVVITGDFVTSWRPGNPDRSFMDGSAGAALTLPENSDKLYWIKLLLPSGGDRSVFQHPFKMLFDCFIAVNKYERTLFKHTGGNRLIEIEIPENIDNVLEIISVIDSNGKNYVPRHEALTAASSKFYTLYEQKDRLCLWFDFSSEIELPPDSITVNYSTTSGTDANGISAGKINELYQNHPGIHSSRNIIPVSGAIPAKTNEQIITEVSARLRGRDRAMSFDQLVSWVKTFDKRILQVECGKGVMRTEGGLRKCVVVTVTVRDKDFYSDDEIDLLKVRLGSFLKARTSINSQFKLEIAKTQ
jgi:hypothetical protein